MTYWIVTLADDIEILCLSLESVEMIPNHLVWGLKKIEGGKAA